MVNLSIEDLTFSYAGAQCDALVDVSLEIPFGSFVCVCGHSGSGKTTLLRHLKPVLAPHGTRRGSVLLNGKPLESLSEQAQASLIGFVMQDPNAQIVTDKVWHELAFGLENLGVAPDVMRVRVAEMASYFGIADWVGADIDTLSGGQKQLLNLASVMAMQPSVLVLDEPTSQLDPIASADFLNTIRKINIELGMTIVITEHRLEDIYASADIVVVMDEGRVAYQGTPREVAEQLHASQDTMLAALPVPARIYYAVEPWMSADFALNQDLELDVSGARCPLTVREGRTWLTGLVLRNPPARTALPEEEPVSVSREPTLRLKDVWFRYERDGKDVLKGLSLEIMQGELTAIVGDNGCGKTTMLKCMCGIERPYRGFISVFGERLSRRKPDTLRSGEIAMLPQNPSDLFVKSTVLLDLEDMLAHSSLTEEERERRIDEVASSCGITHVLKQHPFDLSGGELQCAALAKLLLTSPRMLLLDEPTKGIDCFRKEKLARIIARLEESGMAIVMVSHDVEFCARTADRIAMLFDGEIVTTNTPRAFFSQNSFYTTAANRMSRNVFANAITDEDVIELCKSMPMFAGDDARDDLL